MKEKMKYTFKVNTVNADLGNYCIWLVSNEPPRFNSQVVEFKDRDAEEVIETLKRRGGYVCLAAGRNDFCVIHAGGRPPGCPPIKITPDNYRRIVRSLRECMQAAANFWAGNSSQHTENKNQK